MDFANTDIFNKEFKRLNKKYITLGGERGDFESFKKIIRIYPEGRGEKHWNILSRNEDVCIIKSRLACRYLKSKDLRLIYLYEKELNEITFIEIYFKGDKENEDIKRWKELIEK